MVAEEGSIHRIQQRRIDRRILEGEMKEKVN